MLYQVASAGNCPVTPGERSLHLKGEEVERVA